MKNKILIGLSIIGLLTVITTVAYSQTNVTVVEQSTPDIIMSIDSGHTNLNQVFIQFLTDINGIGKEAIGLTKKETPLVVKEILTWKLIDGIFNLIITTGISIIGIILSIKLFKYSKKGYDDLHEVSFMFSIIILALLCIICGTVIYVNSMTVLKTIYAPKVTIIEYVSSFIK